MILIYQDYVHNNGHVFQAFRQRLGANQVAYADAHDVVQGILTADIKAFVMPGGASRYVADKLNGTGNAAIRAYVEQGGTYIGICAGAYYACARTAWRAGYDDAILVTNELAFLDATASGPIDAFTRDDLGKDHTASFVTLTMNDGQTKSVFYRGGPFLDIAPTATDCQIIARYTDLPGQPPAIVTGPVGQGRYILSSPHVEIGNAQLDLLRFNVVANKYSDIALLPVDHVMDDDVFDIMLRYCRF